MRIAYVARLDTSKETGVLKKILSQSKIWVDMGQDVKVIFITPNRQALPRINECIGNNYLIIQKSSKFTSHIFNNQSFSNAILDFKPDVIYHRFSKYFPWLKYVKINKKIKFVLEINSYDLGEYKNTYSFKDRIKHFYHKLTRNRILSNADGMVCVSNELKEMYLKYEKPIQVISNGIELSDFKTVSAPKNSKPRLLFIGSPNQYWHGLDKIGCMATAFPDWQFDIVGLTEQQYPGTKPSNMIFYGHLNKVEYEELMKTADCAIGTLALHRINVRATSPLKVREYLAYGIPTIIGYKDPDFPDKVPFLLELENEEDNIKNNLNIIKEFVTSNMDTRVSREDIMHIDWKIKEQQRLEFFESIIRETSHN